MKGPTMKAISLWQPWASLIAIGAKQYETRSWSTPYRGPLVIHAAKRTVEAMQLQWAINALRPSDATELRTWPIGTFNYYAIKAIYEHAKRPIGSFIKQLPLGAALCVVDLVDCIQMTDEFIASMTKQERAFGLWESGRFAWKLEVTQVFSPAIPASGKQGLWNWQPEVVPA
jgi:hypothetical protein